MDPGETRRDTLQDRETGEDFVLLSPLSEIPCSLLFRSKKECLYGSFPERLPGSSHRPEPCELNAVGGRNP